MALNDTGQWKSNGNSSVDPHGSGANGEEKDKLEGASGSVREKKKSLPEIQMKALHEQCTSSNIKQCKNEIQDLAEIVVSGCSSAPLRPNGAVVTIGQPSVTLAEGATLAAASPAPASAREQSDGVSKVYVTGGSSFHSLDSDKSESTGRFHTSHDSGSSKSASPSHTRITIGPSHSSGYQSSDVPAIIPKTVPPISPRRKIPGSMHPPHYDTNRSSKLVDTTVIPTHDDAENFKIFPNSSSISNNEPQFPFALMTSMNSGSEYSVPVGERELDTRKPVPGILSNSASQHQALDTLRNSSQQYSAPSSLETSRQPGLQISPDARKSSAPHCQLSDPDSVRRSAGRPVTLEPSESHPAPAAAAAAAAAAGVNNGSSLGQASDACGRINALLTASPSGIQPLASHNNYEAVHTPNACAAGANSSSRFEYAANSAQEKTYTGPLVAIRPYDIKNATYAELGNATGRARGMAVDGNVPVPSKRKIFPAVQDVDRVIIDSQKWGNKEDCGENGRLSENGAKIKTERTTNEELTNYYDKSRTESKRDDNRHFGCDQSATETDKVDETLNEIYEKIIPARTAYKESTFTDRELQNETEPDFSNYTIGRRVDSSDTAAEQEHKQQQRTNFCTNSVRAEMTDHIGRKDSVYSGSRDFNNDDGSLAAATITSAAAKLRRDQSVEEMLAAVQQLDDTVDHLCEMSSLDDFSDPVFGKQTPPSAEMGEKKTSQELCTDVASCVVTAAPVPNTEAAVTVNDTLREFSAIHELCQASSSARLSSPESGENANGAIIIESEAKVVAPIPTMPDPSSTTETGKIASLFSETDSKENVANKEMSDLTVINEAINKNCHFPAIDASHEISKTGSIKRSCSTDSEYLPESQDSSFSDLTNAGSSGKHDHSAVSEVDAATIKRSNIRSHHQDSSNAGNGTTVRGEVSTDDDLEDTDMSDERGLVSAVTSVVRRSLRRVKRLRSSFGRSKRTAGGGSGGGGGEDGSAADDGSNRRGSEDSSEELDERRRRVPSNPRLGLPSVRSQSTSAILLPSLLATLTPTLRSPEDGPSSRLDALSGGGTVPVLRAVDPSVPRIPEPRETLTPPPSSPYYRRDASRSGGVHPFNLPPLSPSRHIPSNLGAINSFRSSTAGTSSTSPSSRTTSPQHAAADSSRSSSTLPSTPTRSSNLYALGNTSVRPLVVRPSDRRSSSEVRASVSQHSRSSSAPNGSSSSRSSSSSTHPAGHTDISAVLISPAHLHPHNRATSPSRNTRSSSGSRTTSPRRTGGSSTELSAGDRGSEGGARSQGGRRGERRGTPTQGGIRSPASPSLSERNTRNNISAVSGATVAETSTTNLNEASRSSRPCSRTSNSRSSSDTVTTSPEGAATPNSSAGSSSSSNRAREDNARRRSRSSAITVVDHDLWPHHHSGLMASLSVTVTVFNISRFAVLGAAFGWPFLVQWVIVSLVLGLPLLTLHVALGQHTGLGALQMWKVAPIFQGVGVSLVLAQLVLGVYCSVPVAWLFVYFRDSFYTEHGDFHWASCRKVPGLNCSSDMNLSEVLPYSIPAFLSQQVQQRVVGSTWQESLGSLKFNLTFNVALIWLLTLLALCKGNKVYGKLSYVLFIVPLLCFLAVCVYIASWTRDDLSLVPNFARAFMNSRSWVAASREVFLVWGLHGPVLQQMTVHNRRGQSIKSHIWLLVITTVLVLVLAAVTGSCCAASFRHIGLKYKPSSFETAESAQFLEPLHKPSGPEVVLQPDIRTSSNALSSSSSNNAILWGDMTGSRYARESRNMHDAAVGGGGAGAGGMSGDIYDNIFYLYSQLLDSYMRYDSLYVGIRISHPHFDLQSQLLAGVRRSNPDHPALGPVKRPPGVPRNMDRPLRPQRAKDKSKSGYQGVRLATELFPAFLGVHGASKISLYWSNLFYLSLLLFGLAQQLAVWRTLVEIVISSAGLHKRRGLVTVCCCLMGLSASLPLATQLGPDLLFFLDYVIGCGWWLMILQLVQVFALLFVRGKPVSAQDLVACIGGMWQEGAGVPGWSVHITAFACSILVPVGLLVLSISSFKSGHYREVFTWSSYGYWPVWASQLASGLQLLPILLVPVVALGQTCRFLTFTRYDVFKRIQMLYRPLFLPRTSYPRPPTPPLSHLLDEEAAAEGERPFRSSSPPASVPFSDPPPKYTPPPSYSTATGMGIAKALNQSVRRSIRNIRSSLRLPDTPVTASNPSTSPTETTSSVWTTQEPYIPPVDYIADSSDPTTTSSLADPPPIYATLDPITRQKVLKVLQRTGIRRSDSISRSSSRRQQNGRRSSTSTDEETLRSQPQATLELQGMDHLAYHHEMV